MSTFDELHQKVFDLLNEHGDVLCNDEWAPGDLREQYSLYVCRRMLAAHQEAICDVSDATKSDSPIEKVMFLHLLELTKETPWESALDMKIERQVTIGHYRADFLVTHDDTKVVIECDGHDYHERTKKQAAHDKKRDRYMTTRGYKVLRYTGSEILSGRINVREDLMGVFKGLGAVPNGVD